MQTDIWSVGITMIDLAYGRPPLTGMYPEQIVNGWAKETYNRFERQVNFTTNSFTLDMRNFVDLCLKIDPKQV